MSGWEDDLRRLDDEWRAEAEEGERLAAVAAARARSLAEVAAELRDRGATVAVTAAGRRLVGPIVAADRDLATVATRAGTVDVHLTAPLLLEVVERSGPPPGRDDRRAVARPASFRARLFQLELAAAEVELTVAGAELPRVRIVAVATDHLFVRDRDGVERFVALDAVLTVQELR